MAKKTQGFIFHIAAIKFALKLGEKTQTFKNMNARYPNPVLSICAQHKMHSDAYYECYVRAMSMTLYHPTGNPCYGFVSVLTAISNK